MGQTSLRATRGDIVRLSLIALALMLACSVALIAYTWRELDRAEARQETELVQHKIRRNLIRLQQETTATAQWDEAYQETLDGVDLVWADRSLGAYLHSSFEHDLTLVFGADGVLDYVAREGRRVPTGQEQELVVAIGPTVGLVQAEELRRRLTMKTQRRSVSNAPVRRTVTIAANGQVYLLGVASITPSDSQPTGHRPAAVLVTGWMVDRDFLTQVQEDIGVSELRLQLGRAAPENGRGKAALHDPAGRSVGYLTWTFERPGVEALRDIGQPILLAFVLLGVIWFALGLRVRRLLIHLGAQDLILRQNVIELTEARDLAQAASRAKSEFIANISHEIRTPLNGILGMTQILERDQLTETQRARVGIIMQSGQALLTVVNDVLDMSKIEAGKVGINVASFDLAQLVAEVCQTYATVAGAKDLALTWAVDEVVGDWLGDADRIRQILLNLVSNAVKFTDVGGVVVHAHVTAGGIAIAVRDDGIGIPIGKLPELFDKFSQVDGSATRRFAGAGLGLAISLRLARLMEGDIAAHSVEGQGSVFTLDLPLSRAPEPEQAHTVETMDVGAAAGSERPLRLLAAEDNSTNRLVLQAMLEPLDIELVLVNDGAQAVEAYRSQDFDLVLMDIQMPVMNGLDAARAIRELERRAERPYTPILALTANVMQHQLEDYADAGLDGHVAKPIEVEALYRKIEEALISKVEPPISAADQPIRSKRRSGPGAQPAPKVERA